jgi:hypothetical protein
MRTPIIAVALFLSACATPRADRAEPVPDSPEGPAGAEERASCTHETPCTLEVVQQARRRAALEGDTEAKMADANVNAQTKRVADAWMQGLARSIRDERDRFSEWCGKAQARSAERRRSGAPGLTSKDVYDWTGPPTKEQKPESRDGGADSVAWVWDVDGPLSRTVSFAILFMRPAGSDDSWIFAGCQWCASGGPVTSSGCVPLPVKD